MPSRPKVIVTYAQSIDGRIATREGLSQWISGPESLSLAQELRRESDAILVGIGTVLADDPLLTCRLPGAASPHRIVLDSKLRIPETSQLVTTARDVPVTVFCDHSAAQSRHARLRDRGVQTVTLSRDERGVAMTAVLDHLGSMGFESLMVEGGSAVITTLFRLRLVDRLVAVIAPMIIGSGVEAVGDLKTIDLDRSLRGRPARPRLVGNDLVWEIDFA